MAGGYRLGVDLGTTYTAAAIERGGRIEVCTLGDRATMIPSLVLVRPSGEIVVGEAAQRRAASEPTSIAREFKRRLGDPAPLVLGGVAVAPEALMASVLRHVVTLVSTREDRPPDQVVLSHPASYGPYKTGLMRRVAELADVPDVELVAEPQAAAISYAQRSVIDAGAVVAVYDFGGGTFDAALVRRTAAGGFDIVGQPEGIERLGGIDLDQLLMEHVLDAAGAGAALDGDADAATRAALAELRDRCQAAKEALSVDPDAPVAVNVGGVSTVVTVTRDDLDAMARPRIMETVEALQRAIRNSGLSTSQVDRVLLVGGSSRMPLVADTVRATLHRPVAIDANPKTAICEGAALLTAAPRPPAAGFAAPPPPPPVAAPRPAVVPPAPTAHRVAAPPAAAPPRSGRTRLISMVAVAALVVIATVAVAVALLGRSSDGESAGRDPGSTLVGETSAGARSTSESATSVTVAAAGSDTSAAATTSATTSEATVEETTTTVVSTTTVLAPVVEPTAAPVTDPPPPTADEQLTSLLDTDREFVIANMLGGFVVQVNAKFIDQVDDLDGLFYDAQAIVDTYHAMEQLRGPIVIIRQDEFNHTDPQPDLFQMLLRETFPSQAAGRAWCDASGLGTDDCLARARPLTLP